MRVKLLRIWARIFCLLLTVSMMFSFTSCAEKRSASELMGEFVGIYGIEDTIYSPAVPEGEAGHIGEDFFIAMYGEKPYCVSDYAIVLLSDLSVAGECAVFLCYSDYDAITVTNMLNRRLDLIRSLAGSIDTSYTDDAFILRRGKIVVMCALEDNELAYDIWKGIIS